MEILFMGTGTSQGVPMIACDCAICRSTDPRNRRSRTAAHVVMDGLHVQIDAAPEFRVQCIEYGVRWVDVAIITHGHADHVLGMDDFRRFCDSRNGVALPVYSTREGMERVAGIFPYAILEKATVRGYPAFSLMEMPPVLEFPQGTIYSVRLPHGSLEVLGLIFQEKRTGTRLAYFTDCKSLPPKAVELARGADLLVLDALRHEPHPTHMCIAEAVEAALDLAAEQTFFVHLTHTVDHETVERELPEHIHLAYDGLRIQL